MYIDCIFLRKEYKAELSDSIFNLRSLCTAEAILIRALGDTHILGGAHIEGTRIPTMLGYAASFAGITA